MATLHRLGKPNVEHLEHELLEFSAHTPIALTLPCHVKELGTSALRGIIKELKSIQYIKQIVVGIDGANAANWQRARKIFSQLPQKPVLIWNDGPRVRRLMDQLIESDLDPPVGGNSRSSNDILIEAHFAAQRITKGVQINEKVVHADNALQRPNQRGHQEAHNTAVQFVSKAGAVAFAEIEAKVWMRHRIAKSGEQVAVVGENVTVVHGHHMRFAARQHVTKA